MGKIICYTSFTYSYLAKARLLAWSLKRFHPNWEFVALITDKEPEGFIFDINNEPFDTVMLGQELPIDNIESWMFTHNIVEMCTAVKGKALDILINSGADKVIYIDPDIAIFESLDPIVELLNTNDIILTPHQLAPAKEDSEIMDTEISSLKHGIYNLGFVAINNKPEGKRFSKWWSDRLIDYCYDDTANGLFTDQRWCDHVPVFFDNVKILKDPGYNVASWNLSTRKFSINEKGEILINNKYILRFYHFTKLGPVGEAMTARYAQDNIEVYEVWNWYQKTLENKFTDETIPNKWWYFDLYKNGEKITQEMRTLYKNRNDVKAHFQNPYLSDSNSFEKWFELEMKTVAI